MSRTTTRIHVQELDCPAEEQVIRNSLSRIPGIGELRFNYIARYFDAEHEEGEQEAIVAALRDVGLTPRPIEAGAASQSDADGAHEKPSPPGVASIALTIAAGLLAAGAEIVAWTSGEERSPYVLAMALVSVALGGISTLRKGWIALRTGTLNINFLMTVAVIGAFAIGEYPEAAMVIFLFGLAEQIEGWALDRARGAVQSLLEMAPDQATVLQPDGSWRTIPASEVAAGSIARVTPGERIPLDGVVKSGNSAVNEAAITGESMPVEKAPGQNVFAGTINGDGALEFETTGGVDDTTISRIIRTVQEAQSERAPTQRFVDQFAQFYTPAICGLALVLALAPPLFMQQAWDIWIYRALVLLVVACPCALVISTPVTVVSGLAAAAQRGLLVKGGVYLERGHQLRVIAVDKTGTITEGRPRVTDVLLTEPIEDGLTRDSLLRMAASLDALSQHPVARAITEAWKGELVSVSDFKSLTGRGVEGLVDGRRLIVGNHRLAEERKVCSEATEAILAELESVGKTAIIVASEQRTLGVIGVADRPRETSIEAIKRLHERGIRLIMLSGDNSRTAQAIAGEVGLDEARGELLPESKLEIINELLEKSGDDAVGMVGDGVNDAPALAKASIGFAMGAAGTDTAIETADVALMKDDLRGVAEFVDLSQRTSQILIQNIVIALGAKAVFLVLTFFGLATLWLAVVADVGASLVVIANGLRLLASREPTATKGAGHDA